jgi:hypothetical protein
MARLDRLESNATAKALMALPPIDVLKFLVIILNFKGRKGKEIFLPIGWRTFIYEKSPPKIFACRIPKILLGDPKPSFEHKIYVSAFL